MPPPTAVLPRAWRVEVFRDAQRDDPEGTHVQAALVALGIDGAKSVRLGRGYLLPPELQRSEVEGIVSGLLADPVLDRVRISEPECAPETKSGCHRILVAKKPGVTDAVAQTLAQALETSSLSDPRPEVTTFQAWEFEGDLAPTDLQTIARRILANPVIEDVAIDQEHLTYGLPAVEVQHPRVEVPLRDKSDEELMRISQEGTLSLNLVEMQTIAAHYREQEREPSACELETLAQTWSEHCQHKTFRGRIEMDGEVIDDLLKTTIAAATFELDKPWCVSVFHDNAGIIEFDPDVDEGWDLAFKVETHNHPSAIDPYGGAGTGIGGVIRDILGVGLGAKPIANTDAFFVGPPDLPMEQVPKGTMHPRRILNGVVAGVRDYGNRMGIPTVSGGVWFDEGYVGNPLVFAGTVGLLPRACATKSVEPGDVILTVGGRTGRDGIHGATFSSTELHEESEVLSAAAVQIGDPITEKKVLDGLLRARDAGLYRGITDCGAGGLSSAVGEMGAECGAEVHLEKVPLKYPGLSPEEIWISEAQERMVLAVPPESLDACIATFEAEAVEATAIGTFTDTGRLTLFYQGREMADLDMHFLHEGTPRPTRRAQWDPPQLDDPGTPPVEDASALLLEMLARPGIASKEWITRQYDHEVQGMRVVGPNTGVHMDGPSDGVVLRPLPESQKAFALGAGASSSMGRLDPKSMAMACIDEALRNVVAAGGDPAHTAILDNFSWGNCDKPDQLGALVLAAKGCYEAAMAYETPFISGKDSLNNEYRVGEKTLSIPPTLYISSLSILPDVRRAMTMDAKQAGDRLYLLGLSGAHFGGSEFHACLGLDGGLVPCPDLGTAPGLFRALHGALAVGLVRACHDLCEGGLAVALAEMCLAGRLGADVDLGLVVLDELPAGYDADTSALFGESCSRFLVEVRPAQAAEFEAALQGQVCTHIGEVTDDAHLNIRGQADTNLIHVPVHDLARAFGSVSESARRVAPREGS
jgi:phosphoribosylformylglycinamidine synthase